QESAEAPVSHGAPTVTEEDGIFEITCDSAGVRLRVRHDSYVDADTEPLGTRGMRSLEGLVIRLDRGGAIEGRALRTDGTPMVEARATAHPTRVPAVRFSVSFPKDAETDGAGTFRIEGLAPGRYTVEVRPSDPDADEGRSRRLRAEAEVEAGKTTRVEFGDLATGGSTVRGRVFRGDDPVPGASVQLSPGPSSRPPIPGRASSNLWDQTRKNGSFEIPGVPPGEATLVVRAHEEGLSDVGWWPITVPASGELLFDAHLSGGEIRGCVVRASDPTPIRLARLSVSRERVEGRGEQPGWASATTDGEGRFRIRGLEAGSYRVTAEPTALVFGNGLRDPQVASLAPQSRTSVEVGPDAIVTVDFALEPGGTALVRVTDPSGAPMQGESVFVWPFGWESRGSFFLRPVHSDAAGVARVEGLAPGRYVARLMNGRYASQESEPGEVRAGQETEFRLALREPTEVRVSVAGPEGTPPPDARVWVEANVGGRKTPLATEAVREGEWVAYLVPGEYVLQVQAEGCAAKSTDVRVESVLPKEIAIRLDREGSPK
ncbi:MAG: carboxypeptidase-like regulatory domain-containing protein, partial [Planctomycetes bacterium]|nr:carboxypeptidase-like regulatory domain-containing protein [Planctomycetota bacterium]